MSLSLIGIIFVQAFFINNSLENENKNFTFSVRRSLSLVSQAIEDYEYRDYFMKLQPYLSQDNKADSSIIKQLFIATEDDVNDKTIIHRNTVLEERFKVPSLFFEIDADSFNVSKLSSERVTETYNNTSIDGNRRIDPQTQLREYSSLSALDKQVYEDTFKTLLKDTPVYKRVSAAQVETFLKRELRAEGIDLDFEFAIYDDDLATKVRSENFELIDGEAYGVPVFLDGNNESSYNLWVDFTGRKKYLLSSILWMIVLSIVFTGIIILAYSSAIYQLIR
ncbi:MAG: two-component sensor histidine kinase, partial [Winogradskyella arenosi]